MFIEKQDLPYSDETRYRDTCTIRHTGSDPAESVTVQYNGSRGIDDAVDACYRMLLAVSFDPQQVAQSFIALGEGVYDVTCPGKKDPSST